MDLKLLAWGLRRKPASLPPLWLFTDEQRLHDPRAAVAALPRGRAGVVLRHDHHPARTRLGQDLARICKARRLVLVVAGDVRLAAALRAGVHLRAGRWPGALRRRGLVTSSAHSVPDLRRARAAGANLMFLSPAFPTASHVGTPGLGPLRWAAIARAATRGKAPPGIGIAALGGVTGRTILRLPPKLFQSAGAIGALVHRPNSGRRSRDAINPRAEPSTHPVSNSARTILRTIQFAAATRLHPCFRH